MHCWYRSDRFGISPGKEERVLELLMPIYRTASSSAEPGCITYRINRTVDRSQVLVYEEYINEEAYKVCLIALISYNVLYLT